MYSLFKSRWFDGLEGCKQFCDCSDITVVELLNHHGENVTLEMLQSIPRTDIKQDKSGYFVIGSHDFKVPVYYCLYTDFKKYCRNN